MSITLDREATKQVAKRLRALLKERGEDTTQASALEATASVLGFADWNTLSAALNEKDTPDPAKATMYAQLYGAVVNSLAEVILGLSDPPDANCPIRPFYVLANPKHTDIVVRAGGDPRSGARVEDVGIIGAPGQAGTYFALLLLRTLARDPSIAERFAGFEFKTEEDPDAPLGLRTVVSGDIHGMGCPQCDYLAPFNRWATKNGPRAMAFAAPCGSTAVPCFNPMTATSYSRRMLTDRTFARSP
jgi:hypothetical protein